MNNFKIYIVILTWNGINHTIECLESIKKIIYENFKVILIDNGSTDNTEKIINEKYINLTWLRYIKLNKNYGFAKGNNIGIKKALDENADYILILNNDTIVKEDLLKKLIDAVNKNPDVVAFSPKILNYNKKNYIESAGFNVSKLTFRSESFGYNKKDIGQYNKPKFINFISGCAFFIKADILKHIGLFDETFFAYYEDIDLCNKITKKGYKLLYYPEAVIWHKVSGSTGGYKNPFALFLSIKNWLKYGFSQNSLISKIIFILFFIIYTILFSIKYTILLRFDKIKIFWSAVFNFNKIENPESLLKRFVIIQAEKNIGINARYLQSVITGIEGYLLNLLKAIEKIDKENKYILFECRRKNFKKVTTEKNIKYFESSFPANKTFLRIIWEQFWLSYEIKKNNCKVFHGPSYVVPVFKNCKYVITVHDLSWIYYPKSFTFFNRLYFKIFLNWSIKKADKIIVDSESTKKDLLKNYNIDSSKVKRIYCGCDQKFRKIKNKNKLEKIRKKYDLPDKFILAISTLLPRKNFIGIIQAYASIYKKIDIKLVIVGKKGWFYQDIFKTLNKLNLNKYVKYTGYLPKEELVYFYNLASLFVFPSFYEGFGLPLLEAMASGCPVLASNVSSIPEVVGDAGYMVNPNNIEEIATGIKKILQDENLRNSMIEKGFIQASKFSWDKCAKETIDVYKELL